jgi:hypothetical protein
VRHTSSDWSLPEEALMRRHVVEPAGSFPAGSLFVSIAGRVLSVFNPWRPKLIFEVSS